MRGRWKLPTGAVFVGEFEFDKPKGEGVWILPGGRQVLVEYIQNVRSQMMGHWGCCALGRAEMFEKNRVGSSCPHHLNRIATAKMTYPEHKSLVSDTLNR